MSTVGMLPAPTPSPFPTDGVNVGASEFLDLSFPEDEDPMGFTAFSWNGGPDRSPLKNPSNINSPKLDRGSQNVHVRNGQPTPPYDEAGDHDDFPTAGRRKSSEQAGKRRKSQGGKRAGLSRREKSLERNRVAASKCRQKKKEHTALLEARFKTQWQKKSHLESELGSLRCQILSLKNEVLKHAQCGDGRVGQHLTQMMQQITHSDNPAVPESEGVSPSATTTTPPPAGYAPQLPELSFSLDGAMPELLEQEMRRESKASLDSEASYALSLDENFDELINA